VTRALGGDTNASIYIGKIQLAGYISPGGLQLAVKHFGIAEACSQLTNQGIIREEALRILDAAAPAGLC